MEVEPGAFARNFATNAVALLNLAQLTTPAMGEAGDGALIVTGDPAWKGKLRRLRAHQGVTTRNGKYSTLRFSLG